MSAAATEAAARGSTPRQLANHREARAGHGGEEQQDEDEAVEDALHHQGGDGGAERDGGAAREGERPGELADARGQRGC